MVKKSTAIIIIGFLFGVSLVILAIAYFQSKPVQDEIAIQERQDEIDQIVNDQGAELSFGTIASVAVGEEFAVPIILSSSQFHVVGADIVLNYDSSLVEVVSVENGMVFDQVVGEALENEPGESIFSLVMEPDKDGFTGEDVIATVTMRALSAGTATIGFDHTENERNDTNVSAIDLPSEDILESAGTATVTIR